MRQMGEISIADPGSDKMLIRAGTFQCCHCGAHHRIRPGSGILRGWCHRCSAFFCGPSCEPCVPTEQMIENIEQGRPLDFHPVRIKASGA
jgi:hypothetical protein